MFLTFMVFISYLLFIFEIWRLSPLRLGKNDGIRLIMAREIRKYMLNQVSRVGSSKKHPVPILKAQKDILCQRWKLKKTSCPAAHPQYSPVLPGVYMNSVMDMEQQDGCLGSYTMENNTKKCKCNIQRQIFENNINLIKKHFS